MKKNIITLTLIVFSGAFCLSVLHSATTPLTDVSTYEDVYYARIAADLSKFTGLSKRMDQKDYKTVQEVMLVLLKQDLSIIKSKTNYAWSAEEQKSIAMAKDYVEKVKGKNP